MMERYDELMLGLYQGFVPEWLPTGSRELYQRESLRRRCDLGQTLVRDYRCTLYYARCRFSEDFAQQVYSAWPAHRGSATNVRTGLFLAFDEALRKTEGAGAARELLQFEALAVADLRCAPGATRLCASAVLAAGLGDAEVYRFRYAVPELHARISLYAGASAPASFARDYVIAERTTFVARAKTGRGWIIDDVTSRFVTEMDEENNATASLS